MKTKNLALIITYTQLNHLDLFIIQENFGNMKFKLKNKKDLLKLIQKITNFAIITFLVLFFFNILRVSKECNEGKKKVNYKNSTLYEECEKVEGYFSTKWTTISCNKSELFDNETMNCKLKTGKIIFLFIHS